MHARQRQNPKTSTGLNRTSALQTSKIAFEPDRNRRAARGSATESKALKGQAAERPLGYAERRGFDSRPDNGNS
jgi:hypothetical protein